MEQETLVLVKPDGVAKNIIGEVIARFERTGLQLAGLKMVKPSAKQVEAHYPITEEWARGLATKTRESYAKKGITLKETDMQIASKVQRNLKKFLQSGPIVAMVVRGNCAIELVRKIAGATEPKSATPGTIRGDFSSDSYDIADKEKRAVQNIVHASDSPESAKREIAVWFENKTTY